MGLENCSGEFDASYYSHGCGDRPYERNSYWLDFFDRIARRIQQDFQPSTVLDAGCALGFLVEGLTGNGVDAFGIDISEFAIENVHETIRDKCWQGSITEPFPQQYGLIVTIEVLEHMSKEEAEQAIENLCAHAENILFSSSPYDYQEPTHFNVQPPEYWAGLFARHGFFRDVDYDASFITPWAVLFRKRTAPVHRLIRDYERRFWLLLNENSELRRHNNELREQWQKTSKENAYQKVTLEALENQRDEILSSGSWRLIEKMRSIRDRIFGRK